MNSMSSLELKMRPRGKQVLCRRQQLHPALRRELGYQLGDNSLYVRAAPLNDTRREHRADPMHHAGRRLAPAHNRYKIDRADFRNTISKTYARRLKAEDVRAELSCAPLLRNINDLSALRSGIGKRLVDKSCYPFLQTRQRKLQVVLPVQVAVRDQY